MSSVRESEPGGLVYFCKSTLHRWLGMLTVCICQLKEVWFNIWIELN